MPQRFSGFRQQQPARSIRTSGKSGLPVKRELLHPRISMTVRELPLIGVSTMRNGHISKLRAYCAHSHLLVSLSGEQRRIALTVPTFMIALARLAKAIYSRPCHGGSLFSAALILDWRPRNCRSSASLTGYPQGVEWVMATLEKASK